LIEKTILPSYPALSCIERYFLAWYHQYGNERELYSDSFQSVKQVFSTFSGDAVYECYQDIPRVQDLAESYGIVKHDFCSMDFAQALRIIYNNSFDLVLIKVNDKFFEQYKRKTRRADHYIMVNNDLHWVNEYPLSEGSFSEDDFKKIYGGIVCKFRILNTDISVPDKNIKKIQMQDTEQIAIPNTMRGLEDAIGVLRVSRKRLKHYYESNVALSLLLEEELKMLDKLYFEARYAQIKNQNSIFDLDAKIKDLINIEERWKKTL